MSILMGILQEEYERLNNQKIAYEEDLQELPKGYISKKIIRGRVSYYLQHREGSRVISKYISSGDLPHIMAQAERRKQLEASLRRIREDQKKLRKVLKSDYER